MSNIEQVKDFWNKHPCNIKHSSKKIGTKEYFSEVEEKKYYVEPHIREFAEFSRWKGKKVLEIGCGIGIICCSFARSGAYVTAIDISKRSLGMAKKCAMVYGLSDQITFYHANAERFDETVPIQQYDLIFSFGVVHHSPNPAKIIECIKKYMGSQSELKLMVYNKLSWKVLWILIKYGKGAFWKLDKLIAQHSEAQAGCPVTYSYTKKSVKKLLKGFIVKDYSVQHIFPYSIPEYKRGIYKKVWYFRWFPIWLFHWLETKIGWHLCVKATL